MIEVVMASIGRAAPDLAVLPLVAKTTMGFSDPGRTTRNLARLVPRVILKESRVLGKAVPGRATITKALRVAADRVRKSAVVVDHEPMISKKIVRVEK
jgi:hypothetical protein